VPDQSGPKSGGLLCLFPWGSWVPPNTVALASAYLRTKWHLDPSNRLVTIHQRYKTHRQTTVREHRANRFTNGRPKPKILRSTFCSISNSLPATLPTCKLLQFFMLSSVNKTIRNAQCTRKTIYAADGHFGPFRCLIDTDDHGKITGSR